MRRWLTAHGARYALFKPVYLGDDLYSRQPTCQAVLDAGAHFIVVCKPASHQTIEEYRTGVALEELTTRVKLRGKWGRHRYRWLSGVPLRDSDDALKVNWFMIEILDPAGKVRRCRGTRRLRPGTLEGRKRGVQHTEDKRLSPGTQFRARPAEPLHRARHAEPAGLRLPHRVRTGRSGLAGRHARHRYPPGVLPASPNHHQLSPVPLVGPLARDARVHQTSASRTLTNTKGPGQPNRPLRYRGEAK
jgi:hypothetical protein